ncbi:Ebp2-domain-containing protein [Aulographum hederae CBS 113979]|uniref:Ebp2-domain-containing protein n=1 Tax=Aulographum hederae CBS 113979 TaxID=1176131 RepID=A0A6G1HA00_9PEZI|nr:Ebp2-domain-containing protein [Aulographum hederae CBS 113979]
MAKSKLKTLLANEQGRNPKFEKQKKQEKLAQKKKKSKKPAKQEVLEEDNEDDIDMDLDEGAEEDEELGGVSLAESASKMWKKISGANGVNGKSLGKDDQWETDSDEEGDSGSEHDGTGQFGYDVAHLDDSDSASEDEEDDDEATNGAEQDSDEEPDEDEDIPLSDLDSVASEEKGDIIPHQRLTINNTAALLKAHKSISLPYSTLPFSAHQTIVSDEPVEIPDINDDLNRELAFYKQSLYAVKDARVQLKKEGLPFTRPTDYFAEMVKTDEHMGKVKQKLVDIAAGKKAAAEARKQRDLKKFGKQVQVAKQQERDKAKKETLERISVLKRKRQGADVANDKEEDLFDVALEDAAQADKADKKGRRASGDGKPNYKRQKKDERYGSGGKKKRAKSNNAESAGDMRDFPGKKMKKSGSFRLGKSKRMARK